MNGHETLVATSCVREASSEMDAQGALVTVNGLKSSDADHPLQNGYSHGSRSTWSVRASQKCLRVENPIRKVTDALSRGSDQKPEGAKPLIALGLGDPTAFGHLKPPETAAHAAQEAAASGLYFGYAPSSGLPVAKKAVAEYYSTQLGRPVSPSSIFITSGSSGALQLCIAALGNSDPQRPPSNLLLPRPGFPVYECMCQHAGVEPRFYDLLPDRDWEADVAQLDRLADENTVALLVCNPGNPCGQVFSEAHLKDLAAAALRLHLPVIADEVYEGVVFPSSPNQFVPFASVAPPSLPVLTTSSLSKKFLLPGWRLGWLVVQDAAHILRKARVLEAMEKLQQVSSSPSCLVQAVVPRVLLHTPPPFFARLNAVLQEAAELCVAACRDAKGLQCPSEPHGSMFMMIRIKLEVFPNFGSDVEWCAALLREESVALIPGTAFGLVGGWARLVLSVPAEKLTEAWKRMASFCHRHCIH